MTGTLFIPLRNLLVTETRGHGETLGAPCGQTWNAPRRSLKIASGIFLMSNDVHVKHIINYS